MKPKYVVYECEECGKTFYREVAETLKDDGAECHVMVQLIEQEDKEAGVEEFPMCNCLGGDAAHTLPSAE